MKSRNFWALFIINLSSGLFWAIESFWINLYWIDHGAPQAFYISLMVAITAIVGEISDVIYGAVSDASKKRRKGTGRKHFMLIGPLLGGIFMCFFPFTRHMPQVWIAILYAIFMDILLTWFGAWATPTKIAFAADTIEPENRGKINGWLHMSSLLGYIIAIGGTPLLAQIFGGIFGDQAIGDDMIFYIFGGFFAFSGIVVYFLAKENKTEPTPTNWKQNVAVMFKNAKDIDNKRSLVFMFINICVWSFGFNLYYPYIFAYFENVLGFVGLESTIVLASLLALSMALGIPFGAIMDKVGHKKEFMYFFGVLQGIFAMLVYILQPGNMIAVILVAGLTQTFYNATIIGQQSIYQDLVPEKQRGSLLIYQVVGFVIPSFPAALLGGWIADMTPIPGQYNPLIFIFGGFCIIISVLFIIPVKEAKKKAVETVTV